MFISVLISGCRPWTGRSPAQLSETLTILADRPPLTLNPRASMDATSQRIGALLFRALTRIDENLAVQPDLAQSWRVSEGGRVWSFKLRQEQKDHEGAPITAVRVAQCLEQYRMGKPVSPLASAFPSWKSTTVEGRIVRITLSEPDAYLDRNLSLLRYFTHSGAKAPCSEPPSGAPVVASGPYRMQPWDPNPRQELTLTRVDPGAPTASKVRFVFIHDDTTRALMLFRGEVDLVQNALSLGKSRWIDREFAKDFDVIERDGVNVSYLAFNLRDPVLSKKKVRQAIAHAIDRERIVKHKFFGFGSVAGSLLSPLLPESHDTLIPYDPEKSKRLLEEAGHRHLTLSYKTTPVREGLETALILQDMLRNVGIELTLEVVEPAVFYATVTKGAFQLHSGRWIGVSDGSILYRTLHSSQRTNRARFSRPEVDRLLEQAMSEPDSKRRRPLIRRIQAIMAEELPYFPLWYWNNAVIIRRELASQVRPEMLSLSGSYEPLMKIRKSKNK